MTQEINRQELVRSLRGLFGFKGSTSFELGETIIPVAVLGDLERPPFHSKIGGASHCVSAAVAAQFGYVGLYSSIAENPAHRTVCQYLLLSGYPTTTYCVIAVLNNLQIAALVAALVVVDPGSWDSVINPQSINDTVRPTSRLSQVSSVTNYLPANVGLSVRIPANTEGSLLIPGPFNIAPGNTLIIANTVLNEGFVASAYWDEYYVG